MLNRDHIILTLCLTLPLALSACGGCGNDNNDNTNAMTMDMGDTDGGGDCTVGEAGCACTGEGSCGDGVTCVNGMCQGAQSSGLTIQTEAARSCEIMLEESEGQVLGATYADGVKGSWRRRAPNVALVITRTEDASFPTGAVNVQSTEGAPLPTIKSVRCFDASGGEIDGASAELN